MKFTSHQKHWEEPCDWYGAIDGLRGIAVLLVVFFHLWILNPSNVIEHLITRLFSAGWIGVDLFFVISGFLITSILFRQKKDPRYFQNFYIRRALRILPLHVLFCILTLIIFPLAGLKLLTNSLKFEDTGWLFFCFSAIFILLGCRIFDCRPCSAWQKLYSRVDEV